MQNCAGEMRASAQHRLCTTARRHSELVGHPGLAQLQDSPLRNAPAHAEDARTSGWQHAGPSERAPSERAHHPSVVRDVSEPSTPAAAEPRLLWGPYLPISRCRRRHRAELTECCSIEHSAPCPLPLFSAAVFASERCAPLLDREAFALQRDREPAIFGWKRDAAPRSMQRTAYAKPHLPASPPVVRRARRSTKTLSVIIMLHAANAQGHQARGPCASPSRFAASNRPPGRQETQNAVAHDLCFAREQ
ncbi:hypothetical protein VTO73DRAFT_11785 [Trametes versicolor]